MNIQNLLKLATKQLQSAGCKTAAIDARALLQFTLNCELEYLLSRYDEIITSEQQNLFFKLVDRRAKLEPIAYIIGSKEFYSRPFKVSPSTLIPRPETELLIDVALKAVSGLTSTSVLELGVGSGCVIVSLLLELGKSASGIAVDVSSEALKLAKENAHIHKVQDRLDLIESDWFSNVPPQKFDLIISNPPYIPYNEINLVEQETLEHEPKTALFAGGGGLEAYYEIAKSAKTFLKKEGAVILEIGHNQDEKVSTIFLNEQYILESSHKDLAGYNRVLKFKLPSS